uniref:SCP domain-containing protein n=1 Tax=Parastrongyloides trichosuri TaxID=131310 RepID=A0A0N4ZDD8_PARTI
MTKNGKEIYRYDDKDFNSLDEALQYIQTQNPNLIIEQGPPSTNTNSQTSLGGGSVTKANFFKTQKVNWQDSLTGDERQLLAKVPAYTGSTTGLQGYPLTSDLLLYYYYQQHDKYRACHGADPLRVNQQLIDEAQQYAEKLASIDKMEHDMSNEKTGENLATSSIPVGYVGVEMWYDEYKKYNFATGKYNSGVGHFTQMVWKGSNTIGCGAAISNTNKLYVVCRYYPRGNILSYFTQNVGQKTC